MTGSEFLTYVKRVFARTDKDTEIYEATTDVISDIRIQIKSEEYKEEAYVAGINTIGEYRLALPSDFGHLIGLITLVDNNGNYVSTLNKLSKQSYDNKYGDRLYSDVSNVLTGVPEDFCIYAKQIYLGPVPDDTSYKYYLNYTTEDFKEIEAATDPVPFTDKYRNVLRAGVLAELYLGLDAFEDAAYWRQIFNSGVLKIKSNDDDNITSMSNIQYSGI
jgi:hypothetical protein